MALIGTVLTREFQEKWEDSDRLEYLEAINEAINEIKACKDEGLYAQRTLAKLEEVKRWVSEDLIDDEICPECGGKLTYRRVGDYEEMTCDECSRGYNATHREEEYDDD